MATRLNDECALENPPTTALWSENFALVFTDPRSRTAALFSIGTWYHDTSVWRENLAVRLPDGRSARILAATRKPQSYLHRSQGMKSKLRTGPSVYPTTGRSGHTPSSS